MKELEVPKLTWEERYRRMIDIAYALSTTYKTLLKEQYGEQTAIEISKKVQATMSGRCARKLIQYYDLKPTVEDVIKLMKLYSSEVWGYGADKYVGAYLESPRKGLFVNKVCRIWEKRKDFGDENRSTCHINCAEEYGSLARQLAPQVKVTVGKAYPKGDDCCEFFIEEPE
ncbi:MAG: hypothetical protein JRH07_00030 [Deltaproteobacteria bacterium]|nr:hypothetical protein [Deltaproteobacteria bacterium]MBW2120221.1 hypothetical protein [Deltaproteobacteria bacterium]